MAFVKLELYNNNMIWEGVMEFWRPAERPEVMIISPTRSGGPIIMTEGRSKGRQNSITHEANPVITIITPSHEKMYSYSWHPDSCLITLWTIQSKLMCIIYFDVTFVENTVIIGYLTSLSMKLYHDVNNVVTSLLNQCDMFWRQFIDVT